ncbi:class I adenylate-forming enzyme family protein [Nocardioides caldifontis]|uniref:class I adenylate-forming enzyme family protein n=1 Tax=Nocardioides caldifontis TaxID=2588938 RepID=UPI0011DF9A7F|nr:AMP-binding protein [Nocardioides caldifontis]
MDYSYPLLCASERYPHDIALIGRDEVVTYAELEQRISRVAGGLAALGLAGRTVGLLMDNRPEAVEALMALSRAGSVAVPLNPRLTSAELEYIAEDCDLEAVIAADDYLHVAQGFARVRTVVSLRADAGTDHSMAALRTADPVSVDNSSSAGDDAPATITYTSGTTGRPKGVIRSHRANVWNVVNSALGSPRRRGEEELFNLPVFGIGFLHFLLPALLGGTAVVLDGAFAADRVWRLLHDRAVTRTFLAPTMIARMLAQEGHEKFDCSSLHTIQTAYAMTPEARLAAVERFGDVFEYMYGLTEAQLTCASPDTFVREQGNVGRTMGVSRIAVLGPDGTRLGADEVGQIAFSGPSVMSGYHGLPEETAAVLADGWVLTGDLGRLSADGELHYQGRSKEMIKTGGFSVDPTEVENTLSAICGVAAAAVVGVPDDHWGEAVVAFLVGDGASVDVQAVLARCREQLAGFKTPKAAFVVSALPENATGKIDRARLRALAVERYR